MTGLLETLCTYFVSQLRITDSETEGKWRIKAPRAASHLSLQPKISAQLRFGIEQEKLCPKCDHPDKPVLFCKECLSQEKKREGEKVGQNRFHISVSAVTLTL